MNRSGRPAAALAAVDLGATSGRVSVAEVTPDSVRVREVHRFANRPRTIDGTQRWDLDELRHQTMTGLRAAVRTAGALDAVSVDGWAVDYVLLGEDGTQLADPVHYRDARNHAAAAEALTRIDARRLYERTGTQLQPFNTAFQLVAEEASGLLTRTHRAVLLPDYLTSWLTGDDPDAAGTELTNASTTGLLDPVTRGWAVDVATALGTPIELFPLLREPRTVAGRLRDDLIGPTRASVVRGPSHDTAAAVAAVPTSDDRFAYVSTGTWALVGLELDRAVLTPDAQAANFTNELGVDKTVRFLRNVTGFWLLEEYRRHRARDGATTDLAQLLGAAAGQPPLRSLIDVQDEVFLAPDDMPAAIAAAAARLGTLVPESDPAVVRCVLDSIALAVAAAIDDAQRLAGRDVETVHLVGGGVANELFCQLVADASGRPVIAGPAEASTWGNVLSQAIALGVVADTGHARALVARCAPTQTYRPDGDRTPWRAAAARVG